MWKIFFYVLIAYLVLLLITKIFDKRKVKKYGRNIEIGGNRNRDNNTNDDGNDDRNADVGTDKQ